MMPSVNLVYEDFPTSGLGDRLIDLYLLSCIGYSRIEVGKIIVPWGALNRNFAHPSVPEYRFEDIRLSNVMQYMKFPENIIVVDIEAQHRVESDLPLTCVQYTTNGLAKWIYNIDQDKDLFRFHQEVLSDIPYETVVQASKRSLSEFLFTDETMSLVSPLMQEPYAALHIRRTDKVRASKADELMIDFDELDLLNQKTYDAIEFAVSELGIRRFYVCSDDDSAAKPFMDRLLNMGCSVIPTPNVEKWKTTYCDLAMMSKAQIIIQSQKVSVFSNIASLIGNVRLFNVLNSSFSKSELTL
jgi:hypothetical protein